MLVAQIGFLQPKRQRLKRHFLIVDFAVGRTSKRTELDKIGISDNFNFSGGGGGPSFLQVCEKRSQGTLKKWNVLLQQKCGC